LRKPLHQNANPSIQTHFSCRRESRPFSKAMWTRFLPAIKIIKDWITTGHIGEVKLI
jgi:hypothetical protein